MLRKRGLANLSLPILCLYLVVVRCFDENLYTKNYDIGIDYIQKDQYELGIKFLDLALKVNQNSLECTQLLGTLYYKQGNVKESLHHMRYALKLEESLPTYSATMAANFVEILRATGDTEGALRLGYDRINYLRSTRRDARLVSNDWMTVFFNLAIVEAELQHTDAAISLYREAISFFPSYLQAYRQYGSFLLEHGFFTEAEEFLKHAVTLFPNSHQIFFLLGGAIHNQKRFEEALRYYYEADRIEPTYYSAKSNIGAALQSLGRAPEALRYYEAAIPFMMGDPGILNNYGALLGTMNRKVEEVFWLEKAIALDPTMEHALTNLAGYYQDEGLLDKAADYLNRASKVSRTSATLLKLRSATMLSPICATWDQMVAERVGMRRQVEELLRNYSLPGRAPVKVELDTSLDRIHFYIQYHGLNDRHLQELIAKAYLVHMDYNINYYNPLLLNSPGETDQKKENCKARVGFLSKFFGVFEPHGLLLDGVMKYLPRSHFEVIALSVARTDGKTLSPGILESADIVQEVSLDTTHALEAISKLNLDILIFADVLSEPMNHFLAHSRLAKTQIAFWGNPITSGSASMDYFVSADIMEHPHRTRMHLADEPYTEQVVLTEGQGIWYFKPESPEVELKKAHMDKLVSPFKNYTRSSFALEDDWFIFLLPQSVFKIHPLYDTVMAQILVHNENIHLMVTGGRRQSWTDIYKERLRKSITDLDQTGKALNRLHVIERVSSEKFNSLLSLADVILHPFPFDGSKTSADALNAGKPLITLPAEHLRGRMGVAFLRTMNIPELVARNVTEYIQIAIRLFEDRRFYSYVREAIIERIDLIWEDMEVPFAWAKFLEYIMKSHNSQIFDDGSITWNSFIAQTGRNSARDTELRSIRTRNQQLFDMQWGHEDYLVVNGVAVMESYIYNSSTAPRIFTNWRRESDRDQTFLRDEQTTFPEISAQPSTSVEGRPSNLEEGTTVARSNMMASESEDAFMNEFRGKVLSGRFEEAVALGRGSLERRRHDARFLLELGVAEYFRGDYSSAFKLCSSAYDVAPRSALINGCIGVAGLYLSNMQNQTIRALLDAWLLMGGQSSLLTEASRQHYGTTNTERATMGSADDGSEIRSSLFAITRSSVEHSLVQGLGAFQRYEECIQLSFELLDLPDISHGGAYILAFSVVDWSEERSADLNSFGEQLRKNQQLFLEGNADFLSAIRQVQSLSDNILNPLLGCLTSLPKDYAIADVLQQLVSVVSLGETANEVSFMSSVYTLATGRSSQDDSAEYNSALNPSAYTSGGLVLLIQYFDPPDRARQVDLDTALAKNLANPAISEIYFLNEREFEFSTFPNSFKIRQFVISKRLTFKDAFTFANTYLANRTVILANADIYFDQTLLRLGNPQHLDLRRKVLALLKWIDRGADGLSMSLRTDSQDAWIFQPPMSLDMIKKADFAMGLPRCDNRIAFLFDEANYSVINPVFSIRAIEIDTSSRAHSLYEIGKAVTGEGKNVLLSDKFKFLKK